MIIVLPLKERFFTVHTKPSYKIVLNNVYNLTKYKCEDIYNLIQHDSPIVDLFEPQLYKEENNSVRTHDLHFLTGTPHHQEFYQ